MHHRPAASLELNVEVDNEQMRNDDPIATPNGLPVQLNSWQMLGVFGFCILMALPAYYVNPVLSFVIGSLAMALGTFGLLTSTALVENQWGKFGSAAAVSISTLLILLFHGPYHPPFDGTDVRGSIELDGQPVTSGTIHLLGTRFSDNRRSLTDGNPGYFEFNGVPGLGESSSTISLLIDIDQPVDYKPYQVKLAFQPSLPLRVQLNPNDLIEVPSTLTAAYKPQLEIAQGRTISGDGKQIELISRTDNNVVAFKNLQNVLDVLKQMNTDAEKVSATSTSQVYAYESETFKRRTVGFMVHSTDLPHNELDGIRVAPFILGRSVARGISEYTVSNDNNISITVPSCEEGETLLILVWIQDDEQILPASAAMKFTVQ